MGREVTKGGAVRSLRTRNTMAFPRELRRAIPELHAGRILELDSIAGEASNGPLPGRVVRLKLTVKETGRLDGEFVVAMDLQVDAARQLAATLTDLADKADKLVHLAAAGTALRPFLRTLGVD